MLLDCSVCSKGYGAPLAYTCRRCSDVNVTLVAVALAIVLLAVVAAVWRMVFYQQGTAAGGIIGRLEAVLPLQSLKIIIVAWQIVIQVSLGFVRYTDKNMDVTWIWRLSVSALSFARRTRADRHPVHVGSSWLCTWMKRVVLVSHCVH